MNTITSYGSITIMEVSDAGQLSVYPTTNSPLSIIYNPDQNTFIPNWGVNNATITPVIFLNSSQIDGDAEGLTVEWKRREGIGELDDLTEDETVDSENNLVIVDNVFTSNSTTLSYIVSVSYTDAETNNTLSAEGQITFTLIKQSSTAKTCSIIGDNVFKYNTNQQIVGSGIITLTGATNNVSIIRWEYKTTNDTWAIYPNSTSTSTLNVNATDNVFVDDKVVIRLLTDDQNVYDIHTIVKIRDGAAGSGTITGVLTNEDQMIPFSSGGIGDFSQAVSQLLIYEGGIDTTDEWSITQSYNGVTAVASATQTTNDTVNVTGISGSTGSVTFTAQKTGFADIVKTFSLIRITAGADGVSPTIYGLDVPAFAINKDSNGNYTPSSIVVNCYSKTGSSAKTNYSGRLVITSSSTSIYSSSSDEYTYTISSADIALADTNGILTVKLYQSGGTTVLLDTQSIVITADGIDGQDGQDGQNGVDAINVIIGNQADVIPCDSDNTTLANYTITIPFVGYKGTTQVACNVATPSNLFGVSPVVTQATSSAQGSITYSILSGTSVSSDNGSLQLTFTCEQQTITHIYTWSKSKASSDGENASILTLTTPDGNVFINNSGTLRIVGMMYSGATDVTSSVTAWEWAKYSNNAYNVISGATSSSISISGNTIDGYGSYRCKATYNSVDYIQYCSLIDKTDALQVEIISTMGEQIINGQGVGAVYAIAYANGVEVDPLKTTVFSSTAPVSPSEGDYYYALDSTNKTVTLKKYESGSWGNASSSDLPTGIYIWSFRDKDGNIYTPTGLATSGKVIYIDGTLINKKIVIDVEVEI